MNNGEQSVLEKLESGIRNVPDFPKKGILFKDITPLLKDPDLLTLTRDKLYEQVKDYDIDYVVGLESRGFIFGPPLALKLGAGFVPVRKPNKLPYDKISQSYELEYGTDLLEIHADGIPKGARVLIHDDLIATGGSAKAAVQLVERLEGNIVACSFIIELSFLNGRDVLPEGLNIHSILKY